jgi:serine/threonine-protein kinase SRPK3
MKTLAAIQPKPQHVMFMTDDFDLTGPNGSHKCLVFDLVGPNIPDITETYFSDGRLPGDLAKRIAKQALIGLESLHQHKICHGGRSSVFFTFGIPKTAINECRPPHSQLGLYDAPDEECA